MDTKAPTASRNPSKDRFKLARFPTIRPAAPTLLSTSLNGAAPALHANIHGVLLSRLDAPASSPSLTRPSVDCSLEWTSPAQAPDRSSAAPLRFPQEIFPPHSASALSDHSARAAAGEPRLSNFLPPPPPESAPLDTRGAPTRASPRSRAIAGRSASLPESASRDAIARASLPKRWLSSPSLPLLESSSFDANSRSDGRQQCAQPMRDYSFVPSCADAVARVGAAHLLRQTLPPAATLHAPGIRPEGEGVLRRQRSLPRSITCC
ncbi:unnamed protein product [Closterium sp. Yama58-4]|nr:unnamed protein product [Closterium sp. Yama58-4]CAI5474083.1 unnamed protein product [Closterium sp. Yama58-4]